MSTVIEIVNARAKTASVSESELIVGLEDGRTLSVPLVWYPRLAYGTPEERGGFQIIGHGAGLHWPHLDEDVSIESMLAGQKPGESAVSLKRWKGELDRRSSNPDPGPWGKRQPLPEWWDQE